MDLETARSKMLGQQIRAWDVLDPRVLDVLGSLPRERFVPQAYRQLAFADTAIPLAHGEVMMTPKVEGRLLQALDPQPGEHVLEVGTGSGFVTAALSRMAASVHSVDLQADFTRHAGAALRDVGVVNASLETRDSATLDWCERRYDCIAVTGSLPELPASFRDRLSVGGRLFVVVGSAPVMAAQLITRTAEDDWAVEPLFETVLPALRNAHRTPRFSL